MICANISRIIYCPVMLLYYRAFFFRSPRLPFIHQERFEQMCRGRGAKCRQGDIYIFFIFLSFLKIPYLKIRENFVLSCRHPFFGIYYTSLLFSFFNLSKINLNRCFASEHANQNFQFTTFFIDFRNAADTAGKRTSFQTNHLL